MRMFLLLLLSFTSAAFSSESYTCLLADLLLPGRGPVVRDAALVFFNTNGTIRFVGNSSQIPPGLNITSTMMFPVLMPGMWDAHTHYGGTTCAKLNNGDGSGVFHDLSSGYYPHNYRAFGCALQMLRETLCAGVTSVRELGGTFGQALRPLVESGLFPAPHLYYAQRPIGITGGHTDQQYLPISVVRNDYNTEWEAFGAVCDGVADCVKRVREQLRAQSDVVKIMTTGGVLSAFDQPTDQEFSEEEVVAMVAEAKRAGRAVAAHAHGADGIALALKAGVLTIEHGSYLTPALARQAAQQDALVVPTVTIIQTFNQSTRPPYYDPLQWEKGQEVLKHSSEAVRAALAANVTLAAGTDCPGDCAQLGTEIFNFNFLFGVDPLTAIQFGTYNGPLTLGSRAPKSGWLVEGYVADVIALRESPLSRLAVLREPDQITHVFKAGKLMKSPDNKMCVDAATNPQ